MGILTALYYQYVEKHGSEQNYEGATLLKRASQVILHHLFQNACAPLKKPWFEVQHNKLNVLKWNLSEIDVVFF